MKEKPKMDALEEIMKIRKTNKAVFLLIIALMGFAAIEMSSVASTTGSAIAGVVSQADEITGNVMKFCDIMTQNPNMPVCENNVYGGSIDLHTVYPLAQAIQICPDVEMIMNLNRKRSIQWHFGGDVLKIFSPEGGDHPVAVCQLPL